MSPSISIRGFVCPSDGRSVGDAFVKIGENEICTEEGATKKRMERVGGRGEEEEGARRKKEQGGSSEEGEELARRKKERGGESTLPSLKEALSVCR